MNRTVSSNCSKQGEGFAFQLHRGLYITPNVLIEIQPHVILQFPDKGERSEQCRNDEGGIDAFLHRKRRKSVIKHHNMFFFTYTYL